MTTVVVAGSTTAPGGSSMTIRASGAFADAGLVKLPLGRPRTFTLRFAHGNLVVLDATGPTRGPLHLNQSTCGFSQSLTGTFRVLSGASTGVYAGATGHGSYTFTSGGTAPKASASGCATPGKSTAAKSLAILFRGPVLLNDQPAS